MDIALDMDDVVLDFVAGVCATVSRDYGVYIQPADITDWNFGQFLDPILKEDWWVWMERNAWLWGEKFKPVFGALGGVELLRRAGHGVEMITSKPKWAEDQVWVWLGRYKPPFSKVTIIPVGGREPSPAKAAVSSAYLLVDDKPENCQEWAATGRPALLYSRPHNAATVTSAAQEKGFAGRVVRVKNWDAIMWLVPNIAQELVEEGIS